MKPTQQLRDSFFSTITSGLKLLTKSNHCKLEKFSKLIRSSRKEKGQEMDFVIRTNLTLTEEKNQKQVNAEFIVSWNVEHVEIKFLSKNSPLALIPFILWDKFDTDTFVKIMKEHCIQIK